MRLEKRLEGYVELDKEQDCLSIMVKLKECFQVRLYGEIAYGFTPEQEIDGIDYDSNCEFGATVGIRFAF